MELTSLGVVIAERRLAIEGSDREVVVALGAPQPFEEGRGYYCPWQIRGIGSEKIRFAGGLDEFQALQLAMPIIGASLAYWQAEEKCKLTWEGDPDLGFPSTPQGTSS
jgi:hypothetical protein